MPFCLAQPEPVVVVDEAECTCPLLTSDGEGLVIGVDVAGRVGLHRLEPLQGGLLAVGQGDGGHDGLEVGLAGGEASFPFHFGSARSITDVGRWAGLSGAVL